MVIIWFSSINLRTLGSAGIVEDLILRGFPHNFFIENLVVLDIFDVLWCWSFSIEECFNFIWRSGVVKTVT